PSGCGRGRAPADGAPASIYRGMSLAKQHRVAPCAANASVRVVDALAGSTSSAQGAMPRRRTSSWKRALLLALSAVAPGALAADLQISNLSDTGYDPTPVGGPVVYHVVVENGDIDTVSNAVALFDLPAGATPGTLPAFCSSLGGSPV